MFHYKLNISYDGTRFSGWQRQSQSPEKTIQGRIEHVLSLLFDHPIQIIGSGRTDAGVHALNQVANFHAPTSKSCTEIHDYLIQYLPKDIAITSIKESSPRFHARYNCIGKTYIYRIDNNIVADPFTLRFAHHVPSTLDVNLMQEAANYLIGSHDFQSFTSMKSKKKSTIKTINNINITKQNNAISLCFKGNGFLQHMVRIITGTLIEVGLGQIKPTDIISILESKTRSNAGHTAPANGLCLQQVDYD
ncbi:MAG: tRNA pseudouridine(38-40) synthase TruA [Cellulosilyticaceae bacterium]